MNERLDIKHRGGSTTTEMYKGIPVHAAPGVHAAAVDLVRAYVGEGARVADLGAGQGALSQRLHDAGFAVTAIDVSNSDWKSQDVACTVCDLDGDWSDVKALGTFDAVVAVEVIEHLENPRDFLRRILSLQTGGKMVLVVSTPNPLDTFSAITLFTRGTFNWFSPSHYAGGGHISILPFWLIDKHLEFLGQAKCTWSFHSPFRHKSFLGRKAYAVISLLRRLCAKSAGRNHFDGETALGVVVIS
jgi:hypothetical protein